MGQVVWVGGGVGWKMSHLYFFLQCLCLESTMARPVVVLSWALALLVGRYPTLTSTGRGMWRLGGGVAAQCVYMGFIH